MKTNFNLLETQGFVVVPGYLDNNDLQYLVQDFNKSSHLLESNTDPVYTIDAILNTTITDKLDQLLAEIRSETNIQSNLIFDQFYIDSKKVRLNWHQDHESYYIAQTSYNEINLWIPLQKSSSDKQGLCVIPFDQLRLHLSESTVDRLTNRGASAFRTQGDTTVWFDDVFDQEEILPVNLDSLSVTPMVSPGDILVIRGDLIHRTQPDSHNRVALSVRYLPGDHVLTQQEFKRESKRKQFMKENHNYVNYGRVLKILTAHFETSPTITVEELIKEKNK